MPFATSLAFSIPTATTAHVSLLPPKTASFYEVLGVPTSASCQEVKSAYRKLARVLHPDVASAPSSSEDFRRLHAAYVTLSDPEKRAVYDGARSMIRAARGRRRTWETDQCW